MKELMGLKDLTIVRPSLWTPPGDRVLEAFVMSGLDGSGAVQTVLTWEALGGHVPPGGSEMYWFDQSYPIHPGYKVLEALISGDVRLTLRTLPVVLVPGGAGSCRGPRP